MKYIFIFLFLILNSTQVFAMLDSDPLTSIKTVQFAFSDYVQIPADQTIVILINKSSYFSSDKEVCYLIMKEASPIPREIDDGLRFDSVNWDYLRPVYEAQTIYTATVKHVLGGLYNQWMIITPQYSENYGEVDNKRKTDIKEIRCGFYQKSQSGLTASISDIRSSLKNDQNEKIKFILPD